MTIKWLDRTLMSGPFLTLCMNEKEQNKVLSHLKLPSKEWPAFPKIAHVHTLTNPKGFLCCVVCVTPPKVKDRLEETTTIVHESIHVWQSWVTHTKEHDPGAEQEAYTVEHIFRTLVTEYGKRRKWKW